MLGSCYNLNYVCINGACMFPGIFARFRLLISDVGFGLMCLFASIQKRKKKKNQQPRTKRRRSSASSEEELVELSRLEKERNITRQLKKKKNKRLEERIEVLEKRNDKLQDMLQNELKTLASRSCCGHQCSTSTNHGAYEHEATHRSIQEKARPLQFMQPSPPSPPPPSPPLPSPPPLWPCSPLSPQGWSATLPLPPPQHLLLPEPPSPSSEQPRMQPCPLMPPVPHPGTTSSGSQEPTTRAWVPVMNCRCFSRWTIKFT
ncbi:uncharacterized protein LOC142776149 isoform X1 [Rhipicephalus microplus]|uniref:uncharacterized protein LOC142776149 isoform X1 n=1 Tax=Rhipicephalus microplus TaxID=6941 RepID=UPI003F6B880A